MLLLILWLLIKAFDNPINRKGNSPPHKSEANQIPKEYISDTPRLWFESEYNCKLQSRLLTKQWRV